MKKKVVTLLGILFMWQILAVAVNNDILIPYPGVVMSTMFHQLTSPLFYESLISTAIRSMTGLFYACLLAFLLASLAYFIPLIHQILSPIMLIVKSIPNISYILLVLVWFGSQASAVIVCFLIIFPVLYMNILSGFESIDKVYLEVMKIYPAPFFYQLKKIYFPFVFPYFMAGFSTSLGLSFKVGVMSEILGQVSVGIGRQLNICRVNLDMTGIFAWTIWLVLLLAIVEKLCHYIIYKFNKHSMG